MLDGSTWVPCPIMGRPKKARIVGEGSLGLQAHSSAADGPGHGRDGVLLADDLTPGVRLAPSIGANREAEAQAGTPLSQRQPTKPPTKPAECRSATSHLRCSGRHPPPLLGQQSKPAPGHLVSRAGLPPGAGAGRSPHLSCPRLGCWSCGGVGAVGMVNGPVPILDRTNMNLGGDRGQKDSREQVAKKWRG